MAETTFFILGGVAVALALLLSAIGLRREGFPGTARRAVAIGVLFAALVAATGAFAWVQAAEHQEEHAEELAAERAEAFAERAAQTEEQIGAAEGATGPEGEADAPPAETAAEAETTLDLTSPEDGSLRFDTDSLAADAGVIAIEYTNPSPVPHNVAIEGDGETLAEGEVVTDGGTSIAETEVQSGAYVFFCTVPGHREAGMEGELTVR
ncbi:MAG TPA: plastocyanin/azurin family copper-binding protein [Solirubrobacterales bacterium]|nr:plastocyanin/azurin family copper-binding protein [Solirubrobacterales bacterium]